MKCKTQNETIVNQPVFSEDVPRDVAHEMEAMTNKLADDINKMEDVLDKSNKLLSKSQLRNCICDGSFRIFR
jgi:hypothetical protein